MNIDEFKKLQLAYNLKTGEILNGTQTRNFLRYMWMEGQSISVETVRTKINSTMDSLEKHNNYHINETNIGLFSDFITDYDAYFVQHNVRTDYIYLHRSLNGECGIKEKAINIYFDLEPRQYAIQFARETEQIAIDQG